MPRAMTDSSTLKTCRLTRDEKVSVNDGARCSSIGALRSRIESWTFALRRRIGKYRLLSDAEMRMIAAAPTSSNAQLRKIKKPLIERRRRERINECLTQLKTLVLEAMHRDESCYSKMEKADILEMTVAHLKTVQLNPMSSSPATVTSSQEDAKKKYLLGFNECAKEVGSYLSSMEELAVKVGAPLMKHLISCLENIHGYHVGITPSDLPSTSCVKIANVEDYSMSFASIPGTVSDFSGSLRSRVRTAVPVALRMEPYTTVLALCDGLRTVGKLSPYALHSPVSDATENSSVSSSGMASSPCFQNSDSKQDEHLSKCRTSSCSDEGFSSELGSSSISLCHSIFPSTSIYSAEPQASRRFLDSATALIPLQNGTKTEAGNPVKSEVFPASSPSDCSSIWRPW